MKASPQTAWQRLEGGMVLLDSRRGRYFELNGTAARMFELITEGKEQSAVVARIVQEFQVDADTAARDLEEVVETLRAQGFLVD